MRLATRRSLLWPLLASLTFASAGCGGSDGPAQEAGGAPRTLTQSEALAELDSLGVPAGIDPDDFAALRASLRSMLLNGGTRRWTSGAPQDSANLVTDLYLINVSSTNAVATWTYRNVGDYDQNGEVNLADLSALGQNFKRYSTSPQWPTARVADGDGNGEINAADITPLGKHLLNTVSNYILQRTDDPEGQTGWEDIANVGFSVGTAPTGGGFKQFTVNVPAHDGQQFRVVPQHLGASGLPGVAYDYDGVGGPAPLDPLTRENTLKAIGAQLDQLSGADSPAQDEELASFVSSQPGIEAAGQEDGNVWGRFTDGRLLFIPKNAAPASASQATQATPDATRRASVGAPALSTATVISSFSAEDHSSTARTAVGDSLSSAGYATGLRLGIGIEDYATLPPSGVLYIEGEGGWATDREGTPHLCISTRATYSRELDSVWRTDLTQLALAYTVIRTTGSEAFAVRYAITDRFVSRHGWSLPASSLVFLNMPESGSTAGIGFRQALFDAGAGVVLGWDGAVSNARSIGAAEEFFALAAGGAPLADPARPFPYEQVLADMHARGVSSLSFPAGDAPLLYFTVSDTTDGNGMLRPTIANVHVRLSRAGYIMLTGHFGAAQGKVLVDGVELPVDAADWTPEAIQLRLPDSGPGSAGTLVVLAPSGIASEPVTITEWHPTLHYEQTYSRDGLNGTQSILVSYNLHLRAFVQKMRSGIGTLPGAGASPLVPVEVVGDSTATYTASGTLTEPGSGPEGDTLTTIETIDPGTLPRIDGSLQETYFECIANLNLDTGELVLDPYCRLAYSVTVSNNDGVDTSPGFFDWKSEGDPAGHVFPSNELGGQPNQLLYPTSGFEKFDILATDFNSAADSGVHHWERSLTSLLTPAEHPQNPQSPR